MPGTAHRVIVPELLDNAPPDQAAASLQDLVRINRYLGGHRSLRWLLSRVCSRDEPVSFLDVGAASGDMGREIRKARPKARVTALDRDPYHLSAAQFPKVAGDAFRLPFDSRSFDFVFSSLFLHHFQNEEVVALLRESGRVARRAVLAIDLERGPFAANFIPATRWLFRWDPITLYDAPASVRAAFKAGELTKLAAAAGLRTPQVRTHRPWSRLTLVASC